ncbi:MAG: signal peptidase II [Gammaproteobacteria bacterium]|nr:signal peptidase II [Gammaproteobacteria bacterium]
MLRWLWLAVAVVALDQISKAAASAELMLYKPLAVLPGFNLTLMHNTGAAFSFLHDASGWQRWFFAGIAALVSIGIVWWMRKLRPDETWHAVALALILGGALGNLWDRLTLGYVVDFIEVYYRQWYWPAFNLADSAISVGAAMLIYDGVRGLFSRETGHDTSPDDTEGNSTHDRSGGGR